jgi:xanthine/uracil permease
MSQARTGASSPGRTHPVDEILPTGRLAILGFQHVLAMYAGAVAVPLILANAIGLPEEQLVYLIVGEASAFGITTPFFFGLPTLQIAAILSMVLVMLVTMAETTGNAVAVGEIVDRPIREEDLSAGLRMDGFSTALGGVLNSFPHTAYAQNVGLVRLTGVKSRWVVAAAGVFLILLGLFPKLAAVVAAIPLPVLGGAGFVLFGTVAATGVRILSRVDFERNANVIIVAASLAVGLIPVAAPDFYSGFPPGVQIVLNSGITAGSIAAIVLNVAFNILGRREERLDSTGGARDTRRPV